MADRGTRPVRGDRRMSDVEALMWNLEKDPHLSSAFANVTVLDSTPDLGRFRARMERAMQIVPRLRQRVVAGLGRLAPPEWHNADVDLDYHVRRVALAGDGSMRDLLDLAAAFSSDPFDRTRPLWEFLVVEGLEGDRAAMLQKIHHTVTDGEGGVRMSGEFIDFSRDQPDANPIIDDDPALDGPPTNIVAAALDTTVHNVRRGLGVGRRVIDEAATLARNPGRVPGVAAEIAATLQSGVRQLAVTDSAHSPLWTERSLRHRIEVLRISLDDAKRASKALGGSVNDLFVAGAAGGAGAYHRAQGSDVAELRISMPVSTRGDASMGGNAFTPARVLVSCDPDPVARFGAVRDRLSYTKQEPGLRLVQGMAGLLNVLPTSLLVRAARQQVETVDFTTSNVRGAPFDLFIAGAKIEANYPIGPLAGTAFNITTLSSSGWLDMGVNIDLAAIDDPELLRQCIEDAFAELLVAAG
ncbi:MAG: wax ester/triacylglycerol synthase domain-containing protein [Acidimicrobiales bacterium]